MHNDPTAAAPCEAILLRIYIGDADRHEHLPLYEALVKKAREMNLAGATVLKSAMGFGSHSHIHTAKILQLSTDLPLVIEIVDTQEKIETFLPVLREMMDGGMVTMEQIRVIHYRPHQGKI